MDQSHNGVTYFLAQSPNFLKYTLIKFLKEVHKYKTWSYVPIFDLVYLMAFIMERNVSCEWVSIGIFSTPYVC